jgi:hypothetical protein
MSWTASLDEPDTVLNRSGDLDRRPMQLAGMSGKTRLMARVLATVTVLAAPLAVTASPVSATTANRTVSAEATLGCATPCDWFSRQVSTRIAALKLAETQAKALAKQGYLINMTTAVKVQGDAAWRGRVNYRAR